MTLPQIGGVTKDQRKGSDSWAGEQLNPQLGIRNQGTVATFSPLSWGVLLQTVEDYRRHAGECRKLAARARTDDERAAINNMAETWEELARTREKMLQSRARSGA
jgi:hypothetical protein